MPPPLLPPLLPLSALRTASSASPSSCASTCAPLAAAYSSPYAANSRCSPCTAEQGTTDQGALKAGRQAGRLVPASRQAEYRRQAPRRSSPSFRSLLHHPHKPCAVQHSAAPLSHPRPFHPHPDTLCRRRRRAAHAARRSPLSRCRTAGCSTERPSHPSSTPPLPSTRRRSPLSRPRRAAAAPSGTAGTPPSLLPRSQCGRASHIPVRTFKTGADGWVGMGWVTSGIAAARTATAAAATAAAAAARAAAPPDHLRCEPAADVLHRQVLADALQLVAGVPAHDEPGSCLFRGRTAEPRRISWFVPPAAQATGQVAGRGSRGGRRRRRQAAVARAAPAAASKRAAHGRRPSLVLASLRPPPLDQLQSLRQHLWRAHVGGAAVLVF